MPEETPAGAPSLLRFAQEVQALREARFPSKVGVMVPTFNRPDRLRGCVLQLANQSRPPDVICVHQNGHADSYQWAVADLQVSPKVAWLHTNDKLRPHDWYTIPLRWLLENQCSHFFWCDDDDIYLHQHIARGMDDLADRDFSVARRCGLLFTRPGDWRYNPEVNFTSHAPGGMRSSICFNRRFALELLADLTADPTHSYPDQVVAHVTMPKFRCNVSDRFTSVYHAQPGSVTSGSWLPRAFGDPGS